VAATLRAVAAGVEARALWFFLARKVAESFPPVSLVTISRLSI